MPGLKHILELNAEGDRAVDEPVEPDGVPAPLEANKTAQETPTAPASSRTLEAYPSSLIHVYVDDVEAMHERARGADADVTNLEMSPAGDRRFTATDPEGQAGSSLSVA